MNAHQILSILDLNTQTKFLMKGIYDNTYIPHTFTSLNNVFFIVNTSFNDNIIGHWVMMWIYDNVLYFFDSLGKSPFNYKGEILNFYLKYQGRKCLVFNIQIQSSFEYTCGAYCIFFAYTLTKNFSINSLHRKFKTYNTRYNDKLVKRFIYKVTKTQYTCNSLFCSEYMFLNGCRAKCEC